MYKKGGSKVIALYWFVILMIIAGGIFSMVYSFYHYPYDVRELEGEIMINKIADCLSSQGNMSSGLFAEEGFSESYKNNFLNECHINLNVEESWNKEPQYYFEVNFYKSENLENSVFNIPKGNLNLMADCNIQEEKEYKREVKCTEENFFSFHGEDLYLIKILTVIKKTEKNVK